jgi:thiamine pyrophosphokinase
MTKKQKHSEKFPSTIIIVGPTSFRWKVLTPFLKRACVKIFFVDGGLIHHKKFQLKVPALTKSAQSIGDGDSSNKRMTLFKSDQNLSDLSYCLEIIGKEAHVETFLFVGFLGGRIDHQFFNLGEISRFAKTTKAQILLEDKIEFFSKGIINLEIQGVFSLGSFEDNMIKIKGACLYKSRNWLKLPTLSSRGLSNVGSGKIEIVSKSPLAVFYS